MNIFTVALALWRLGHAAGLAPSPLELVAGLATGKIDLSKLLKAFQRFHGLRETGQVDRDTEALLAAPRCRLPDVMEARDSPCKWPHRAVTWSQAVDLPGLGPEAVSRAFRKAWSEWGACCGLAPLEVDGGSGLVVNVVSTAGDGRRDDLDGPGGVLAWSELPCSAKTDSRLRQVYDRSEPWTEHTLYLVALHEIGHAIGVPHLGARSGTVMAPYLNPALAGLTPDDVAEAVARYGPPRPAPAPAPAPAPKPEAPGAVQVLVTVAEPGDYLMSISLTKQA